MSMTAQKLIEEFDALPFEEKEMTKAIIDKLMREEARLAIKINSEEGISLSKAGKLKTYDSVSDLMRELERDDE